jgi:carbon storage regulator CsrA
MLVLNRKANDKVAIEGGITVTVLAVEGGRVRLGIDAPDDVRILRTDCHNPGGQSVAVVGSSLSLRMGDPSPL